MDTPTAEFGLPLEFGRLFIWLNVSSYLMYELNNIQLKGNNPLKFYSLAFLLN